jgi:hypothetical protein
VYFHRSSGGGNGCCDCGDAEAWSRNGNCIHHSHPSSTLKSSAVDKKDGNDNYSYSNNIGPDDELPNELKKGDVRYHELIISIILIITILLIFYVNIFNHVHLYNFFLSLSLLMYT